MRLTTLISVAVLFLLPATLQAQPYATITASPPGPEQVLREGIGKLAIFLQSTHPDNTRQIQAYLDTEIAPYFDFGYMARWVAGATRRYMNPGQFAQFEQGLQRVFLAAMASNLVGAFDGQALSFQRARRGARPNEAIAGIRIMHNRRPPIRMDFRFYRGQHGWKIFDVMSNGSSAVTFYRSYYSRLVRRYGIQSVLGQM